MRWPWSKPEIRETDSYTDGRILATLLDVESGAASAHQTAALEAAAGLYAACLAGAAITPAVPALKPSCLSLMGRDLIRNGESVFLIKVMSGNVLLSPVATWDVRGGVDPASWFYRIDVFAPTSPSPISGIFPAAQVIHVRYSSDSARPWYGRGPMDWAQKSGSLAGGLESRLSAEAQGASGYLLPVPEAGASSGAGTDDDPHIDPLRQLRSDLVGKSGKLHLVETMAAGFGDGTPSAPRSDWTQKRYGVDVPEAVAELRRHAQSAVMRACQVPEALFNDADGTSQREAWRRFAMGPLAGLAAVIEAEVSEKLMTSVKLDFSGLWAHDLAGRAASFSKMVAGNMDVNKAAALSGLMHDDG